VGDTSFLILCFPGEVREIDCCGREGRCSPSDEVEGGMMSETVVVVLRVILLLQGLVNEKDSIGQSRRNRIPAAAHAA
jgi:hypothetical protein